MKYDAIERIFKRTTVATIEALTDGTCEIVDPDSIAERALTAPRKLDAVVISQIARLLVDPSSWFFARKRCLPRKSAVFRMRGASGSVTVTVGFSCVGWIVTAQAERRGGFFDPVEHQIRKLLKEIFPEYASPGNRSLWRTGTIARLKKQKAESETGV